MQQGPSRAGAPSKTQEAYDEDDRSSIASSIRSTHSRAASVDSTGLADEAPPPRLNTRRPAAEAAPLLREQDPPPAYSPRSPANETTPMVQIRPGHNLQRSYGTTGASAEPNVVSVPEPDHPAPQEEARRWRWWNFFRSGTNSRRRTPKIRRYCSRRTEIIIIVLAAIAFVSYCMWDQYSSLLNHHVSYILRLANTPKRCISANDISIQKSSRTQIAWPTCEHAEVKRSDEFRFSYGENVTFSEAVKTSDGFAPSEIKGKIHIRRGSPSMDGPVHVFVSMSSSTLTFLEHISLDRSIDGSGLEIKSDRAPIDGDSCTVINVLISIRESYDFENLRIDLDHLNIELGRDVDAFTAGNVALSTRHGTIESNLSPLRSRSVSLETATGPIKGKWSLLDLLSIKTQTGAIDVEVETPSPEDIDDEQHTETATLDVKSTTGNIDAEFESSWDNTPPPRRHYENSIDTVAGAIRGRLIHSSSTKLTSTSGDIDVSIVPCEVFSISQAEDSKDRSMIITETAFGLSNINVLPPVPYYSSHHSKHDSSPPDLSIMTRTDSSHKTVSGNMRLHYPLIWEGRLIATSLSGAFDVAGNNFTGIACDQAIGNEVCAVKGKGVDGSSLEVRTLTANGEVLISDNFVDASFCGHAYEEHMQPSNDRPCPAPHEKLSVGFESVRAVQ